MQSHLIPVTNNQSVILSHDTDAATLLWLLESKAIPTNSERYEFLRTVIKKRFNIGIAEFKRLQQFPKIPTLTADEYLINLPPDAFDIKLWAHPTLWVVHKWMDAGTELTPLVTETTCQSDLEAAAYIIGKDIKVHLQVATDWVLTNFNLDINGFRELFIKPHILQKLNYYSRRDSESVVVRYRMDILRLLERGHKAVANAENQLGGSTRELTKLKELLGNEGNISLLVREFDEVLKEWQIIKSLSAHRLQPKTAKK